MESILRSFHQEHIDKLIDKAKKENTFNYEFLFQLLASYKEQLEEENHRLDKKAKKWKNKYYMLKRQYNQLSQLFKDEFFESEEEENSIKTN